MEPDTEAGAAKPPHLRAARFVCVAAMMFFVFANALLVVIDLARDSVNHRPWIIEVLAPFVMASILIALGSGLIWLVGDHRFKQRAPI